MIFKFPKNDKQYHWTQHIKDKMLFYRISEQKIKTIIKSPDRHEEGIAPNTNAAMKRNDTPKRKEEMWVMYSVNARDVRNDRNDRRRKTIKQAKRSIIDLRSSNRMIMISAWRYPGKSKPGKEIPIPEDILETIKKEWF